MREQPQKGEDDDDEYDDDNMSLHERSDVST